MIEKGADIKDCLIGSDQRLETKGKFKSCIYCAFVINFRTSSELLLLHEVLVNCGSSTVGCPILSGFVFHGKYNFLA